MRERLIALAIGIVFGLTLCWAGMSSPEVIRAALLFEESYLFLMFGSAVATAALGLWLVGRHDRDRAARREPVERRHVTGSVLFGLGWGVSGACPAPIATQVTMGVGWALFTLAGVAAGIWLFLRQRIPDAERENDRPTGALVSIRT